MDMDQLVAQLNSEDPLANVEARVALLELLSPPPPAEDKRPWLTALAAFARAVARTSSGHEASVLESAALAEERAVLELAPEAVVGALVERAEDMWLSPQFSVEDVIGFFGAAADIGVPLIAEVADDVVHVPDAEDIWAPDAGILVPLAEDVGVQDRADAEDVGAKGPSQPKSSSAVRRSTRNSTRRSKHLPTRRPECKRQATEPPPTVRSTKRGRGQQSHATDEGPFVDDGEDDEGMEASERSALSIVAGGSIPSAEDMVRGIELCAEAIRGKGSTGIQPVGTTAVVIEMDLAEVARKLGDVGRWQRNVDACMTGAAMWLLVEAEAKKRGGRTSHQKLAQEMFPWHKWSNPVEARALARVARVHPALLLTGIAPSHLRPRSQATLFATIRSSPELVKLLQTTKVPLIVPVGAWKYQAVDLGVPRHVSPFANGGCLCDDGACRCALGRLPKLNKSVVAMLVSCVGAYRT
jgi:hypothetical protein